MVTKWDVIVIGAGMAGLKAAHDIQQAGKSVLVLEAKNRIGGRIHTVHDFAPVPIELGGELIHTEQADTWELVHAHNIATYQQNEIGIMRGDKWVSLAQDNQDEDTVLHQLVNKAQKVGMPKANETMENYLLRLGMTSHDYPFSFRIIEYDTELFNRWDAQTLVQMAEDYADTDYGKTDYHVIGGQETLLNVLKTGLTIQLNAIVKQINWGKHGVTVKTESGIQYASQHLILTIPPLVLQKRDIQFVPDLPKRKWQAIDSFGRSDIVKVIFHFNKRLLPDSFGSILDEGGLPPIWWRSNNAYPECEGDVLVGWASADNARQLIAMSESDAIQTALDSLRKALRQDTIIPTQARLHHWNDDPFACGAYPYIKPGGGFAIVELAEPLQKVLFWAGAATSADFSTVHGAYASGKRVAQEVLQKG
ncbi:MAG: FAD-dependent oxidoreductase [Anaerolineae bacterium]|jgi:monoamine oxidase|nr:FAD-dependent oxidoreductase [Anaerolineae bacterium]